MARFELAAGKYLSPTPGGAFLATQAPDVDAGRRVLRALLAGDATPAASVAALRRWSGLDDDDAALEVAHHLQSRALIETAEAPRSLPPGTLEDLLPELLGRLARSGKALLADPQGFYMAASGFPHEAAEQLSALSADLAQLHERHQRMLRHNLALPAGAWALVDAAGNSQLGVWPIYVGEHRFALVASGVPRFNQSAFVDLVWVLSRRYAALTAGIPTGPRAT